MIGEITTKAARETGLDAVALSGGCFMNRLLYARTRRMLEDKGMRVLVNEQLPSNDGSVSFGQAMVAHARLQEEENAQESE
jgi:hydrogenase maturation protein HypF